MYHNKSGKKETTLKTSKGKAPPKSKKNELDNPSSINNYEDLNTAQNKSSFNSKAYLPYQTSSLTIFKRTNTIDCEAKTPMSQKPEEMKEMKDKGSWKMVEKKKKATTPISTRKTRSQTIKN